MRDIAGVSNPHSPIPRSTAQVYSGPRTTREHAAVATRRGEAEQAASVLPNAVGYIQHFERGFANEAAGRASVQLVDSGFDEPSVAVSSSIAEETEA